MSCQRNDGNNKGPSPSFKNGKASKMLTYVAVSCSTLLADKAYGTKEILAYLQRNDADYAISPKCNTRIPWRCDWWLYKDRQSAFSPNSRISDVFLPDMISQPVPS